MEAKKVQIGARVKKAESATIRHLLSLCYYSDLPQTGGAGGGGYCGSHDDSCILSQ